MQNGFGGDSCFPIPHSRAGIGAGGKSVTSGLKNPIAIAIEERSDLTDSARGSEVEIFAASLADAFGRASEKKNHVPFGLGLGAAGAVSHLRTPHRHDPNPHLLERMSSVATWHSDTILDDLENIGVPVDRRDPEGLRTRWFRDAWKCLANTATMIWLQPLGNLLQTSGTLEHGRRPHGSEPFLNAIERLFVNFSRKQAGVGVWGDAQHGALIIHDHQPARTRLKNRLHIQIPVSLIHAHIIGHLFAVFKQHLFQSPAPFCAC